MKTKGDLSRYMKPRLKKQKTKSPYSYTAEALAGILAAEERTEYTALANEALKQMGCRSRNLEYGIVLKNGTVVRKNYNKPLVEELGTWLLAAEVDDT